MIQAAGRRGWRNLRKSCCAAALLLGLVLTSLAQEYVFHPYGQAEGLRDLAIMALAHDQKGFLWVGTQNGLYRFLGSSFQRFGKEQGLGEGNISTILAAPDGSLWVSTGKNLYRWTGTRFEPAASQAILIPGKDGMAFEAPGRLLIVTHDQIERLHYSPDGRFLSVEPIVFNGNASAAHVGTLKLIDVAMDGTVWLTCGLELCEWSHGALRRWGQAQGLPAEEHGAMAFDHKGSVWVVGDQHLLELPHGGNAWIDRSPPGVDLAHTLVQIHVVEDPSGRILIASGDNLQRWDGTDWKAIDIASGMPASNISSMTFDAEGDLWLGTFGSGLCHWVGYGNWEGWREHQGLPSPSVWSVNVQDPTHVIAGTEHGPASIDLRSGKVDTKFIAGPWKYGTVTGISRTANGDMLFGTADGDLLRRPARSGAALHVTKTDSFVYSLFQGSFGNTFFIDRRGVRRIEGDGEGLRLVELPEVSTLLGPHNYVYRACSTFGADWFNDVQGALQLTVNGWRRVPIDGVPAGTQFRGMTCARDGTLWIAGKESGLWHLAARGDHLFATELSLPAAHRSLFVEDLLSDSRGWLWIATDDGLLVWNGSMWRHLTQESGLIWNDLNQFTLAEGLDGSVWMGTGGGVAHLTHPEQMYTYTAPRIALVEIGWGGDLLPLQNSVRMPWSRHDLSIQFAATSAPNREDLVFRYRISSLQPAWTETRDTTAHFQSLPPGRYTFEVFAEDKTSGAQSSTLTIEFNILPPWWRTTWAYTGYALLAGFAMVMLSRMRMSRVLARAERLEQLVAERTAELESSRQALHVQATHDGLTGLLNRMAILQAFEAEIQRAQRENLSLTLVIADIDHFKKTNDTYGHLAGDEALRRFSSALQQSVRPYDHAGRYGGEEFMLVLPGRDCAPAGQRLKSLHTEITGIRVTVNGTEFVITCSLGAVCLGPDELDANPEAVLAAADEALYKAKHAGRNRVVLGELSQVGASAR